MALCAMHVLHPRFGSNLLFHSELLRRYVVLLSTNQQSCEKATTNFDLNNASGSAFMKNLLYEALQNCIDDVSHLRATAIVS